MKLNSFIIKLVKILRMYFIICLFGGIIASFFIKVQPSTILIFILFGIVLVVLMTLLLNHFVKEGDKVKIVQKFTFNELIFFVFKRKICPSCGKENLVRHIEKSYEGRKRNTDKHMNLTYEDVYSSRIIYECENCKKKYTIKGLMTKRELEEKSEIEVVDKIEEGSIESNKYMVRIFAKFWCIMGLIISIISVIQEGNLNLLLLFWPAILLVYFVMRAFTK